MGRRLELPLVLILTSLLIPLRASAQCSSDWQSFGGLPGLNGTAYSSAIYDDGSGPALYVGGEFSIAGDTRLQNLARWNGSRWSAVGDGLNGQVLALCVYNSELVAAGGFTAAGAVPAYQLARWNGTTWTDLGSQSGTSVRALTVYGGELIAAGDTVVAGDRYFPVLAAWNGSTWRSLGSPSASQIFAMTDFDSRLVIAGLGVAQWDGSEWQSVGPDFNSYVYAATEFDGKLVVGGSFTMPDGTKGITQWDGASWQSLGTGIGGDHVGVRSLAVFDGKLFAGGRFTSAGGISASAIARWDGSQWNSVGPGFTGNLDVYPPFDPQVYTMCAFGDELVAGGYVFSAGPLGTNRIARWDGAGWHTLGLGPSSQVYALATFEGQLIVGGAFQSIGGLALNGLAGWDGTSWKSIGLGVTLDSYSSVSAFMVHDGKLIVGGGFSTAGNIDANCIAQWDGTSWTPFGQGISAGVNALAVYRGDVIAAGGYRYNGNILTGYVFRWDGSEWQQLGSGMTGQNHPYILALAVFNDELIAGGWFDTVDGQPMKKIAAWNGSNWHTLGSGPNAPFFGSATLVSALTNYGNDLVVAGNFSRAGATDASNIAQWDGANWSSFGDSQNPYETALTIHKGKLIAAGYLGDETNIVAMWNGADWATLGTGPSPDNSDQIPITSLASFNGDLAVGGGFESLGTTTSPYLTRYGPAGNAPSIIQQPPSPVLCQNSTASLHTSASGDGTLSFQWQKSGQDLSDTPDIFGTQTDTLVFTHAQPADSGPYTCTVMLNNCTQATSNVATLTVYAGGSADGNNDGLVDARDIQLFIDAITNFAPVSAQLCAYDLTGEGIVNLDDLAPFVNRLLTEF